MPKIVDHNEQKQLVAEAAMRVIKREGLEHASVRKIAVEAGISAGSMRHYFSTQHELFLFSMNRINEKVTERISQLRFHGPIEQDVLNVLEQFLPLDEERFFEMEVWQAFTVKALTEKELQPLKDEMYHSLRQVVHTCLIKLEEHTLLMDDVDIPLETERLYAIVNGIALHRIIQPNEMKPELMRSILKLHLYTLMKKNVPPQ
ncbi:TetR/AcrR family transcriptional regulator [Bacillus sp. NPDC077027]|uniref:TetR/AcrR family transcriptional regulator n=1 Tax=Bacillus sp. NPDC077027 TaxID=3390548 RepID=UPI003CFC5DA5